MYDINRFISQELITKLFLFPQKRVDPEVKTAEVIEERSAVAEPAEETKPLQVPELILSESEKKVEKIEEVEPIIAAETKEVKENKDIPVAQ